MTHSTGAPAENLWCAICGRVVDRDDPDSVVGRKVALCCTAHFRRWVRRVERYEGGLRPYG